MKRAVMAVAHTMLVIAYTMLKTGRSYHELGGNYLEQINKTAANSKGATILELLRRKEGATLGDLMQATDWQPHSVRGFLSAQVGKKLGLKLKSTKHEDGQRAYSIDFIILLLSKCALLFMAQEPCTQLRRSPPYCRSAAEYLFSVSSKILVEAGAFHLIRQDCLVSHLPAIQAFVVSVV